ncbi:uncharacterized protein LOC117566952 [Drosophila albomicans]|uniref:Uncharacterized protein LOC117566952 n=1 Tax=Drosophila albomicans TaxID=7291 RepID=A0A6P8WVJ1_DROAB|nr:uncharacterized protein LOC117566952 [Drosophila albomicans]
MDSWWMHHSAELLTATCPKEANATSVSLSPWSIDWSQLAEHYVHYYQLLAIFASRASQLLDHVVGTLSQDVVFVYAVKICMLLFFLFLMHLFKRWNTVVVVTEQPTNASVEVTKELSCEFNFVSEQEKRAAQEAAAEAMLEVEEKRSQAIHQEAQLCLGRTDTHRTAPSITAAQRSSQVRAQL